MRRRPGDQGIGGVHSADRQVEQISALTSRTVGCSWTISRSGRHRLLGSNIAAATQHASLARPRGTSRDPQVRSIADIPPHRPGAQEVVP